MRSQAGHAAVKARVQRCQTVTDVGLKKRGKMKAMIQLTRDDFALEAGVASSVALDAFAVNNGERHNKVLLALPAMAYIDCLEMSKASQYRDTNGLLVVLSRSDRSLEKSVYHDR